jgi:iron complex transport system substrate-binding protein
MKLRIVNLMVLLAFICALPAASAFTLEIFGNANMDGTVNGDDIKYVEGIINGTNRVTDLSDANYDGKVTELDIDQINLIINGTEKNITINQYLLPTAAPELTKVPVTVPMPIKSIAALGGTYGPEMLCVLGDADKIVAVVTGAKNRGEFSDHIIDVPEVGKTTEWDMEKILKLKPDIVLAYGIYDYSSQRKTLSDAGITLVQMDFHKPEYHESEVSVLSWLLGKQERGKELIDFEKEQMDLIESRVKDLGDDQKPRVYAESYKDYQYGSTGSVTTAVHICGAKDIFDGTNGTKDIDPEKVISSNPQVILKMTFSSYIPESGYNAKNESQMAAKVVEIMNRTGWNNMDAVKDKRVYIITSDAASIHPSILNLYVAKWLHPELFKDMDPAAVHREWLQKFLGIELKGVYGYPLI